MAKGMHIHSESSIAVSPGVSDSVHARHAPRAPAWPRHICFIHADPALITPLIGQPQVTARAGGARTRQPRQAPHDWKPKSPSQHRNPPERGTAGGCD